MISKQVIAFAFSAAVCGAAYAEPTWTISPPVEKGKSPGAAPLRKDDARVLDETKRFPIDRIYVEGVKVSDKRQPAPMSVEQRFAAALDRGNPEVPGGQIRHGMFYDGIVYWAGDPLTFLYYNVVNRLRD